MELSKKKILIADSSAVVRSIEKDIISFSSVLELDSSVKSFSEVKEIVASRKIDAIVIDNSLIIEALVNEGKVHAQVQDSITACKKFNIPVLLFKDENLPAVTSSSGICVLSKPTFTTLSNANIKNFTQTFEEIISKLSQNFLFKSTQIVTPVKNIVSQKKTGKIEAIFVGVSTGGPASLLTLLKSLGSNVPVPVFITQHVDSLFDKKLIEWLDSNVSLNVKLAENYECVKPGTVYFAPAETHLLAGNNSLGQKLIILSDSAPVNFLRPSIDKMFESAASVYENHCVAVLLTGMGSDGAKGCCAIKQKGGYTITESEESCVVYGMPKAAFEAGGSVEVLALDKIAPRLLQLMEEFK